ncbi:MAG: hypothetical protein FWE76_02890 [Symbiobacteriaceae bacterium]|nr:hypothetical protein [Symbiobacteriaceae bacterium]
MKTLILFYSYSGNTRRIAQNKAEEIGADIEEISEVKKPSVLAAFTIGCYKAIRGLQSPIKPLKSRLSDYECIIIMSPIWAHHPVPAVYTAISRLPAGRKVELVMVSASSGSQNSAKKTMALVEARGCEVVAYTDLKAK